MDKYLYWLDCIEGLGANAKRNLIEAFGSAEAVYKASENMVKYILEAKKLDIFLEARKKENMDNAYEDLLQKNICICIIQNTTCYPIHLI